MLLPTEVPPPTEQTLKTFCRVFLMTEFHHSIPVLSNGDGVTVYIIKCSFICRKIGLKGWKISPNVALCCDSKTECVAWKQSGSFHTKWCLMDKRRVKQTGNGFLESESGCKRNSKHDSCGQWVSNNLLPNSTLEPGFPWRIALETVRLWLHKLEFHVFTPRKGIFVDGHKRPEVDSYRTEFLRKLMKIGFHHVAGSNWGSQTGFYGRHWATNQWQKVQTSTFSWREYSSV